MMRSKRGRGESRIFWAIIAYFNPVGYRLRRVNFSRFRKDLSIPLLAVELALPGKHELGPDDVDVLISLDGSEFLWQKERLLNIAVRNLPKHVKYVAWLDADVVFLDAAWHLKAVDLLNDALVIQPYSAPCRLQRGETPEDFQARPRATGRSLAAVYRNNIASAAGPNLSAQLLTSYAGLAWVSHRDMLERHGLYDAMICGGADRAMAYAALGRFEDTIDFARMNPAQAEHYRRWAEPFYETMQGRMDFLEGGLLHLWHGVPEDRRYYQRYIPFAEHAFDPEKDLIAGPQGHWILRPGCQELDRYLRSCFENRREDG